MSKSLSNIKFEHNSLQYHSSFSWVDIGNEHNVNETINKISRVIFKEQKYSLISYNYAFYIAENLPMSDLHYHSCDIYLNGEMCKIKNEIENWNEVGRHLTCPIGCC